jgi:hypothetical protein
MGPDSLGALVAVEELRRDLDRLEAEALRAARQSRWTWEAIGAGVGLTRQAAWKRYGRLMARLETDEGGQGRP